ncbi:MAG: response regulator, partial [bacterium]
SVASPIYSEGGRVIASLGMDIPDDYWFRELIVKRHVIQILTGFALGFLILAVTMFNVQRIKNYELGLSENKYRSLFSQSLDAVLIIKPDGSIIDVNSNGRQMLGYGHSELSSISFYDILKNDDYNSSALFFDYLADSSDRSVNVEIENSEGRHLPVELKAYPVTINEDENIIYIILSDLSQRTAIKEEKEKLEDRIKHMEKMEAIGQLAGGIAHDFNNILTVILGNADIILSRSNNEMMKYADKIKQASYRGKKLTQHLLTFARKGHYSKEYTDIHSIIDESVEMFRTTFDKRIKIETRLNAARSIVLGDPGQLENMIINLGLNARDAITGQGYIRITTENVPGTDGLNNSIRIVFRDNGIGMNKQTISRIFEPFFTTKEEKKGTGLGLSSVYGTVKKYNGSISVNSEPGMGSEFAIVLPVTERKYVWKHKEELPDKSYKANIILIDDEENIRLLAEEFLSDTDYSIITFKNGLRGLSYYKEHYGEVDLVILDIVMPVMSGSETYDKMREIFPDIKVLVITGYSVEEQTDELRKKGVRHFLSKPFDRKELLDMIHRVISP